jgi:hypothetical protein
MATQSFHNQKLTRVKVRNNILMAAEVNEDGDIDHLDVARACGVIAALSPMVSWGRNKQLAKQLFLSPENWDTLGCLKANAKKAYLIVYSDGSDKAILEILKGKKTSAFFLNIWYP